MILPRAFSLPTPLIMNKALTLFLLASLPVQAAAQDRIEWTDGTVTDRARVTEFTVFEIRFSVRATRGQRNADQVVDLQVERVQEAYRRAFSANDPELFLGVAKERLRADDKFIAQFGFYHAARLYLASGDRDIGFGTLDELKTEIPNTGFLPDCYRLKIESYLEQGQAGAARALALAQEYQTMVTSGGMPKGFGLEAEFYEILAEYTAGTLGPADLHSRLSNLLVRVSGPYPSLGNRTELWIATSKRLQGQPEDAREMYEELVDRYGVDVNTRAGAYLGLGHVEFAQGNPTNRDAYREALLNFLRVYMETQQASDALVAEALHFASEAAEKWGGQDAVFMNRKLRSILTQEYPNNPWK